MSIIYGNIILGVFGQLTVTKLQFSSCKIIIKNYTSKRSESYKLNVKYYLEKSIHEYKIIIDRVQAYYLNVTLPKHNNNSRFSEVYSEFLCVLRFDKITQVLEKIKPLLKPQKKNIEPLIYRI